MLKRRISVNILLIFLWLILPSFVASQPQEYKDYTAGKGDTLWKISDKELKDPSLWPKIWKENPSITDPDKIYPGQKIKIPLFLLQKERKPEPKAEIKPEVKPEIKVQPPAEREIRPLQVKPVQKNYLVNKNFLVASGYIADSLRAAGKITSSQNNKNLFGKGDYVYIKTAGPVKKGEKFYIIRSNKKVLHPKTVKPVGYLIEVLGIGEVADPDRNDSKMIITDSYAEILPGDFLDAFYEIEPPLSPQTSRNPDVNGFIVATRQLHDVNGAFDIVYLDKGRKDGIEIGDFLATTLQSKHKITNGLIQIIDLRGSTTTAIIRSSDIEIAVGDGVTAVRQR
jgi:LysM repeat protein